MHIRKKRAFENDKFIYQLWHHRGQCELAHDCTMGWYSKEGEKPYFQMRARAYRLHLANVATGELAFGYDVSVGVKAKADVRRYKIKNVYPHPEVIPKIPRR